MKRTFANGFQPRWLRSFWPASPWPPTLMPPVAVAAVAAAVAAAAVVVGRLPAGAGVAALVPVAEAEAVAAVALKPATAGRIPEAPMCAAAAPTTSTSTRTSTWKVVAGGTATTTRLRAPQWLALPSRWVPRRVPQRLLQRARLCIPVGAPFRHASSSSVNRRLSCGTSS